MSDLGATAASAEAVLQHGEEIALAHVTNVKVEPEVLPNVQLLPEVHALLMEHLSDVYEECGIHVRAAEQAPQAPGTHFGAVAREAKHRQPGHFLLEKPRLREVSEQAPEGHAAELNPLPWSGAPQSARAKHPHVALPLAHGIVQHEDVGRSQCVREPQEPMARATNAEVLRRQLPIRWMIDGGLAWKLHHHEKRCTGPVLLHLRGLHSDDLQKVQTFAFGSNHRRGKVQEPGFGI
mmetsp:Transcript_24117/g.67119  ORF Transcript_24117/g.67119 Transcript_24117/m.67119 type:complete len:236 (-) Transcript_24117:3624-4331(-)